MKKMKTTNVLIAEDDALLNDGIASQLVRLGYTPAGQAYDGAQAVELACQKHPSVVLMDLQMIDPDTGREDAEAGLKATRAIQERSPAAVIVLTAHESPDLVRRATEAGVSGYLVKPAADPDLDRMIAIARARFDELLHWRGLVSDLELAKGELQASLAKAKTMTGLVSVCAWCKKVQDEGGAWLELEAYVKKHSAVRFSHGVCSDCCDRVFPKFRRNPADS